MRKLTILVDMDDTLEDLLPAWVAYLNRKHHTAVNPEDITSWDLHPYFPALTGQQLYQPLQEESFWDLVKPKREAPEYLKRLLDDGHSVYIVTSSHYRTLTPKLERVLFRYFPYLTWEHVVITSHKELVMGDVLIDDGVHNHTGGPRVGLLMDAPHNRNFCACGHGLKRVDSWAEIYVTIRQLAAEPQKGVVH